MTKNIFDMLFDTTTAKELKTKSLLLNMIEKYDGVSLSIDKYDIDELVLILSNLVFKDEI